MGRKPIDVSLNASEMMSADLTVIIMVIPRGRVFGLHLTNELDGIDTLLFVLDLRLLRFALTPVLRHRRLNLLLGIIHLIAG